MGLLKICRKHLHLLFLLSCVGRAGAQQLYLRHFTVDEGLPSNEVYQVGEDANGNLLIVTDRGAARFDGYSVEPLTVAGEKTVTPVYYLYKNKQGKIYLSGLKGRLYTYEKKGLMPVQIKASAAMQRTGTMTLIANTLATRHDSLWISYNSSDYPSNLAIGTSLLLPNGQLQALNQAGGFYFNLQKDFYHRELKGRTWPNHKKEKIHITWEDGSAGTDSVNLFWDKGYVRRPYAIRQNGYTLFCLGRQVLVYQNKRRVSSYLLPGDGLSFSLLSNGTIGVGMSSAGFAFYRLENGKLNGPFHQQLGGLSVTDVYEDRQKGLWLCTQEDGLYYAYPARTSYSEKQAKIRFIDQQRNQLIVAYETGELEYYRGQQLQARKKLALQEGEFLIRFSFQQNGSLVVVTNRGQHIEQTKGWLFVKGLNLHLLAANDSLVYGTDLSLPELRIYAGFGGRVTSTIPMPGRILSAHLDKTGSLWLGTWEGLYQFRNHQLKDMRSLHPAFADRIVGIGELPSGWMAVATLGSGLILQKGSAIIHLTAGNGLNTSIINSIRTGDNSFYLGTNKGIMKVYVTEEGRPQVYHYATESGMPTLDVHQFAVTNGEVYGKWVNKLFHFSTSILHQQAVPTNAYLQQVQVQGRPVSFDKVNRFNHQENAFDFHFTSVHLSGGEAQTYRYQLEGFEDREHETKQRLATYTNLPPGKYAFTVRVLDAGQQLGPKQVYRFQIAPAFWQTGWFLWIAAFILLSLVYALFRMQLRVAKEKDRLHLRLAESNQRALIQLINPHFISNMLNTVYAAVMKGNKIEAATVVSRFARLMRLTMEVGKEKFVRLEQELELIREYLTLEKFRSPQKFDWALELDPSINPDHIFVPGMLIQPFVENAIKHGVTDLPHKGQITIHLSLRGSSLFCRIEDNGIGLDNGKKIRTNKEANHQSAGMSITKSRLVLLHEETRRQLVFEVNKKFPDDKQFPGTVVRFSLPFKKTFDTYSQNEN